MEWQQRTPELASFVEGSHVNGLFCSSYALVTGCYLNSYLNNCHVRTILAGGITEMSLTGATTTEERQFARVSLVPMPLVPAIYVRLLADL